MNQSLAAAGTRDLLLQQRTASELVQIARVRDELARRVVIVPWRVEEPVGAERLRQVAHPPGQERVS